jgi:DNA helicase II / ATP-dependent DNA helicase PcrA
MSLHKSKGLTSRAVIVGGSIRGLIPFEDQDETDEEQAAILLEQRRLFYVAITRCTEILVLSSALRLQRKFVFAIGARIQGWWNPAKTIASQFIAELGPDAPAARLGTAWLAAGYA